MEFTERHVACLLHLQMCCIYYIQELVEFSSVCVEGTLPSVECMPQKRMAPYAKGSSSSSSCLRSLPYVILPQVKFCFLLEGFSIFERIFKFLKGSSIHLTWSFGSSKYCSRIFLLSKAFKQGHDSKKGSCEATSNVGITRSKTTIECCLTLSLLLVMPLS